MKTIESITPSGFRGPIMRLRLRYTPTGEILNWSVWRDKRNPALWMLREHDGNVKTLESNWRDCIPVLKLRAENNGAEFLTPIS